MLWVGNLSELCTITNCGCVKSIVSEGDGLSDQGCGEYKEPPLEGKGRKVSRVEFQGQ